MNKDEMLKLIKQITPLKPYVWFEVLMLSKHIKIYPNEFEEGKTVFEKLDEIIKLQKTLEKNRKDVKNLGL